MRQRWVNEYPSESPLYTFVSIVPNSGTQDGGDPVVITISGFDALNTNEVRFGCDASGNGGDPASFSAINSTVIDVTTPLSTSGTGVKNVVVEVSALQRAVGIAVFTYNV